MNTINRSFVAHCRHKPTAVESVRPNVDACITAFEAGDIALLRYELLQLTNRTRQRGGGKLITCFAEKDRLAECFIYSLQYGVSRDGESRTTWAENGFYCIVNYLSSHWHRGQDVIVASLDLFLLLYYGADNLVGTFNVIVDRYQLLSPIELKQDDLSTKGELLLNEFQHFAATLLSVLGEPTDLLVPSIRPTFERAKCDHRFAAITPREILHKMNFMALIIETKLNKQ